MFVLAVWISVCVCLKHLMSIYVDYLLVKKMLQNWICSRKLTKLHAAKTAIF